MPATDLHNNMLFSVSDGDKERNERNRKAENKSVYIPCGDYVWVFVCVYKREGEYADVVVQP